MCFQPRQCLQPCNLLSRKKGLSYFSVPLAVFSTSTTSSLSSFQKKKRKLISSDMTELWKPWAEVLQMLCHHAKHGRKQTLRQLSDAAWEIGVDALPRHRLFDFSLYLSFQLHRQTALCLPCSAGLVLILARENVLTGKWWQGSRERKVERWREGGAGAEGKNLWFKWCIEK